jgi:pyruvate dehydrogenase phosphatase
MWNVVSLLPATSTDHLDALSEVRDFATTDMGRGDHHRWTYRILSEPTLSNELRRASNAFTSGPTDGVLFQPHPLHEFRNQDRAHTEAWPTPGGVWMFNAVFDGKWGVQHN